MVKKRSNSQHPGITVFRRKDRDNRWAAQWRDPTSGKLSTVLLDALGFSNKAQALPWLKGKSRELLLTKGEHKRESPTDREYRTRLQLPLKTAIQNYLEDFGQGRSPTLTREREYRLRPFVAWLEGEGRRFKTGATFSTLALNDFHKWLKKLKRSDASSGKGSLSPTTKNMYQQATSAFLNWCRKGHYINLNRDDISEHLPKLKVEQRTPTMLKPPVLRKLINALATHDTERHLASRVDKEAYYTREPSENATLKYEPLAPLVLLLLLTGMRRGEALHLRWDNVDFSTKVIHVTSDKGSGWTVKTGKDRQIPFEDSPALESLLKSLKLKSKDSMYVIESSRTPGKPRNFSKPAWNRLLSFSGLEDITTRSLRSTHGTALALASKSFSPYDLAMRMGHAVEVAQKHYITQARRTEGETVEAWLGVEQEVHSLLRQLGYAGKGRRSRSSA